MNFNLVFVSLQIQRPKYTESKFDGANSVTVDPLPIHRSKYECGDYYQSYTIKVEHVTLNSINCLHCWLQSLFVFLFLFFFQSDIPNSDVFIFEYTGEWTDDGTYLPKNLEEFVRFVDRSIAHQRIRDSGRLGLVVHDRFVIKLIITRLLNLTNVMRMSVSFWTLHRLYKVLFFSAMNSSSSMNKFH